MSKKPGKKKSVTEFIDPETTAHNASSFLVAANRCNEKRQLSDPNSFEWPVTPTIVCYAFSTELYLKAIFAAENNNKNFEGHGLLVLFNKISSPARDQLAQGMGSNVDTLRQRVDAANSSFVDWRYIHEKESLQSDVDFLGAFAHALEKYFLNVVRNVPGYKKTAGSSLLVPTP